MPQASKTLPVRYDYAIGDIQGCYSGLLRLLDKIAFDDKRDRLWLVGDLVNRGPESLQVLRFLKQLPIAAQITLGNHDLYLLSLIYGKKPPQKKKDTIHDILTAPDSEELAAWLCQQNILHYDPDLNMVMTHAGIPPIWDLEQAINLANELENTLRSNNRDEFFQNMLGNSPNQWSEELTGIPRLRLICNYFTRMRFCHQDGSLNLSYKGSIASAPSNLLPWFNIPGRKTIAADIIFGHWASLEGQNPSNTIHALDTGYVWGGHMTALRLQDKHRLNVHYLEIDRR